VFVVQVVDDFSIFGFLYNNSNNNNNNTKTKFCSKSTLVFRVHATYRQITQHFLSPDSASLSDSLSSSELELLEALAWLCTAGSSSSSSAGVLRSAGGGCFSRSWRQIFSLLLIREIEVLWGGAGPRRSTTNKGKKSDMQKSQSVKAVIPCAAN